MESESERFEESIGDVLSIPAGSQAEPRNWWRRLRRKLTGCDPDDVRALQSEAQHLKIDLERVRQRMKTLETQLEDALAALAHGTTDDANEVRLDNQGIVSCRGFAVMDKHGRVRIQAGIDDNGDATICWMDPMGKRRVVAGTALNGDASVLWLDTEGKRRMGAAAAANGNAGMYFADRNDVMRVGIATKNSGTGGVHVYDKDGKLRISAATFKGDQLSLPNEDLGAI